LEFLQKLVLGCTTFPLPCLYVDVDVGVGVGVENSAWLPSDELELKLK